MSEASQPVPESLTSEEEDKLDEEWLDELLSHDD
jgi:hypothetical protein